MPSSSRHSRQSFGRSFLGSSPFVTPFALPVHPVLEALDISPSAVVVELGAIACRFTLPIARYLATENGSGIVHACEFKREGVERIRQKAKDAHLALYVVPQLMETGRDFRLPATPGTADVVIAVSVPRFRAAPGPFLDACIQALHPGGQLFLAEWRDARKLLSAVDDVAELSRETAWRILMQSGELVCAPLDILGLEWAVSVKKPTG